MTQTSFVELGLCLRMFRSSNVKPGAAAHLSLSLNPGPVNSALSLSTQDDYGRPLVYNDSFISTWYIVYSSKLHSTSYTCNVSYMRISVNLLLCKSDMLEIFTLCRAYYLYNVFAADQNCAHEVI